MFHKAYLEKWHVGNESVCVNNTSTEYLPAQNTNTRPTHSSKKHIYETNTKIFSRWLHMTGGIKQVTKAHLFHRGQRVNKVSHSPFQYSRGQSLTRPTGGQRHYLFICCCFGDIYVERTQKDMSPAISVIIHTPPSVLKKMFVMHS